MKVMQTLYSLSTFDKEELSNKTKLARMLDEKLEHVLDIFTVCVLYPLKVAEYAETDSIQKSSKYIRTVEDMKVNTRIAVNSFVTKTQAKVRRGRARRRRRERSGCAVRLGTRAISTTSYPRTRRRGPTWRLVTLSK